MKIMTILGTRPEIIRLSRIIAELDQRCEHTLVHTGQNYDERLNDIFFSELQVRPADIALGIRAESFGGQIGRLFEAVEELLVKRKPDRLLILGDTNSGLSAVIARRLGVPVYHMEAGNRCYDDRVPEEVNRRVIDQCSSVLMPYTRRSKENLIREGIAGERIFVTGNPILEAINYYAQQIDSSSSLQQLQVSAKQYFLVTMHRAENVDFRERLRQLVEALHLVHQRYGFPVICSFHPRARAKAAEFGIQVSGDGLHFVEPFGFFDFVKLERSAFCLLSDSGTVQEEACIFGVPNVTIRDVTERPETIECGSNVLSGVDPQSILAAVEMVVSRDSSWQPPEEYLAQKVSRTVCNIVLGYRIPDAAERQWQCRAASV